MTTWSRTGHMVGVAAGRVAGGARGFVPPLRSVVRRLRPQLVRIERGSAPPPARVRRSAVALPGYRFRPLARPAVVEPLLDEAFLPGDGDPDLPPWSRVIRLRLALVVFTLTWTLASLFLFRPPDVLNYTRPHTTPPPTQPRVIVSATP